MSGLPQLLVWQEACASVLPEKTPAFKAEFYRGRNQDLAAGLAAAQEDYEWIPFATTQLGVVGPARPCGFNAPVLGFHVGTPNSEAAPCAGKSNASTVEDAIATHSSWSISFIL